MYKLAAHNIEIELINPKNPADKRNPDKRISLLIK